MKKLILLLLLVCTGTTLSWAQGSKRVTVSGTVVDGDDKSPIAQATYSYFLCRIVQWQ